MIKEYENLKELIANNLKIKEPENAKALADKMKIKKSMRMVLDFWMFNVPSSTA